jgi:thiamine phosphate synthase YjbQ (UPF0047 family)
LSKVVNTSLTFSTNGEIEFVDLSEEVQKAVDKSGIRNGLVHIFGPHANWYLNSDGK